MSVSSPTVSMVGMTVSQFSLGLWPLAKLLTNNSQHMLV